ncbi:hypothetical protein TNCT_662571 [Trichonephila clavata]|uniref:Uncharacterized protein n=1 Tax=Trichonephila clavata TaxID=2740835 RepID=A0A8X6GWP9_TRICU|nr:hypothetical protein TNCT_662571 [Trichonephila clavata]
MQFRQEHYPDEIGKGPLRIFPKIQAARHCSKGQDSSLYKNQKANPSYMYPVIIPPTSILLCRYFTCGRLQNGNTVGDIQSVMRRSSGSLLNQILPSDYQIVYLDSSL